jgi:hypothetical protein
MGDHNNVVISREVFAIIGKEIMPAATRKPTAMHENHYGAFMGTIDLGCPKIEAQAVFASYSGCSTTMEYECIFIRTREILSIGVEVRAILVRADATILQRVANPAPGLGSRRRHEAPWACCRSPIGRAFENVDTVPPEAAYFSSGRLSNSFVGGNNPAVSTTGPCKRFRGSFLALCFGA